MISALDAWRNALNHLVDVMLFNTTAVVLSRRLRALLHWLLFELPQEREARRAAAIVSSTQLDDKIEANDESNSDDDDDNAKHRKRRRSRRDNESIVASKRSRIAASPLDDELVRRCVALLRSQALALIDALVIMQIGALVFFCLVFATDAKLESQTLRGGKASELRALATPLAKHVDVFAAHVGVYIECFCCFR